MPMPNDFWWVALEAAVGTLVAGLLLAVVGLLVRPTEEVVERLSRVSARLMAFAVGMVALTMVFLVAGIVRENVVHALPGPDRLGSLLLLGLFVSIAMSMVLYLLAGVLALSARVPRALSAMGRVWRRWEG